MRKGKSQASAERRAERRQKMQALLVAYRMEGATREQIKRARGINNIGQMYQLLKGKA